jgi:hypothetical protein
MAKNGIITPTKDVGECLFHADMQRGKVLVTVRAPLSIDKRVVEVPVDEILEVAAQITLEWLAYGRAIRAHLEQQQIRVPKEAPKPA